MENIEEYGDIELLLSDVDGVMTCGTVTYDESGIETKTFHVRDGLGIKLWRRSGGAFGIVTSRDSPIVSWRAEEIGIDYVKQGATDKLPVVKQIARELGLTLDQVAYLGDDLPDLPVIRAVGLGVAVADAAQEVQSAADYVTKLPGGRGAVRELVELLLKGSGQWDSLVEEFAGSELQPSGQTLK